MLAHFKAFLYDTLVNLLASVLLDLLHLLINEASSITFGLGLAIFAPSLCG